MWQRPDNGCVVTAFQQNSEQNDGKQGRLHMWWRISFRIDFSTSDSWQIVFVVFECHRTKRHNLFHGPQNILWAYWRVARGQITISGTPDCPNCCEIYAVYTQFGERCSAVCGGTELQAGRSRFRFPMVLLEFFIDVLLPAHYGPGVESVSNRNEYQEYFQQEGG